MPRRKQQNPQPVKLDSENGIGINTSATVTFEGDCLLNQDLIFPNPGSDSKIIGLEKFSADITFPGFALRDDENSSFSHLSMESDSGENEHDEGTSRPSFPPYLPCRGCAQHLSEPLGSGMDLVGAYCMRCCKGDPSGRPDRAQQASNSQHGLDESRAGGSGGEDESLKPHSCMLCGFSSRYTNHVKRHMKTHNGEKPYRCPLCSYASAQLVNLQRHLRIHTGEKPYKCEHCSFACSSLGNLKRHQRMHTVRSPAQNTHQQASGHALRRLGAGPKLRGDAPNASSEAAQSESSLNVAGDGRYLHAFSGLKTGQQQQQQRSSSRTLALAPGTGQGPGPGHGPGQGTTPPAALPPLLFPFTCRLCGMALDDEDGSSAQICAKCTLEMLTKDASGAASERSDKVYTCAACPFLTHYPNHLARHMKTHSGEKPYKCPQCDYASAHFDNLKRHHRVHTGEKPYKCHLCDYACGNLANLKRHQRVHSGAKPFQCAICSYSCNQSMNLKRHMLRHTGEKPHKCQQCGYTTGHWDNYKRHQKKHGLPTDGWVKVPMHANEEEVENDEV